LCVVAGVAFFAWRHFRTAEERAFAEARKDYDAQSFTAAAPKFDQLAQKFPDSENASTYRFLAELADVRAQVFPVDQDPPGALARVQDFLKGRAKEPILRDYYPDVWRTLVRLREDLVKLAEEKLDEPLIAQTKQALDLSKQYKPLDTTDPALQEELARERGRVQELEGNIQKVEGLVAREKKRREILAGGDRIIRDGPNAQRIRDWKDWARREGFEQEGAILAKLAEIEQARLARVVYRPREETLRPIPPTDPDPSLLIAPQLGGYHSTLPLKEKTEVPRVVFALVRGVLYALLQRTGEVLWATRVGIDQTILPIRLPRAGSVPERVLVLSSDDNTLTARDVTDGRQLWQHRLSGPCLSRPVIVGNRAYLATVTGRVEEIEIVQGRFLGWYDVGEPLLVGGAHQENTNLLYFPADSESVFVLDLTARRCAIILDTGHPSGSLRGEPIVVSQENPNAPPPDPNAARPGTLILCQTQGLDAMKLRAYNLPIADAHATPHQPEPIVRGWSWLTPYCDGETLLLATDEGILGIFGLNQLGNDDPLLFPIIQQHDVFPPPLPGNVNLFPNNPRTAERDVTRAERAQVVRISEKDFAVLVQGELQLLHLNLLDQKLARVWPLPRGEVTQKIAKPLEVGFPLHGSQLDDRVEFHTLVVVTQARDGSTCKATAVDTETGQIHWQRQLGMVCEAPPLLVSQRRQLQPAVALGLLAAAPDAGLAGALPAALALPVVHEDVSLVTCAKEGAMYRFNSEDMPDRLNLEWYINKDVLAEPVKEPIVGPVHFLHGGVGEPLYTVASSPLNANDYQLVVRRYEAGKVTADQFNLPLPGSALAGTPGLWGKWLVMPLAKGHLARVPLEAGGKPEAGPNWQAKWAGPSPVGHVVALSETEFLTTDGFKSVTRWNWPLGTPVYQQQSTYQFPARIVAAPALVSPDLVCVATGDGVLTLLGTRDLKPQTTWPLGEYGRRITAGPFVRTWGGRTWIGCVLDHRRLVWLDPEKAKPAWLEPYEARETIVGEPQLVGDLLLVADQSGRFVGLDPRTGRQRGPGYTLQANVTPATTPVAFGSDRAFVPLTDGTVLLLSLGHFRGEAPAGRHQD
jgi:outer membrane protein assembly factor BamB